MVMNTSVQQTAGKAPTLWSDILEELSLRNSALRPVAKHIFIFGDEVSGKQALISQLQGANVSFGSHKPSLGGLQYKYMDVRDEEADDHCKCSIWSIGQEALGDLLEFALNEDVFKHCILIIIVDLSKPWEIPATLSRWGLLIRDHLLNIGISSSEVDTLRPDVNEVIPDHEESKRPQIVVVATKSDAVTDLSESQLDFIQAYLRHWALIRYASLVYVSSKDGKNCDVLYTHLLSLLYGLSSKENTALVVERDGVFVPAGWDSITKIGLLYEGMSDFGPDTPFEDVITQPPATKISHDSAPLVVDDEQAFLLKMQTNLSKPASSALPANAAANSLLMGSSSSAVSSTRKMSTGSLPQVRPGAGVQSEQSITHFFNSLLMKKTSPGGAGTGGVSSPASKINDKSALYSDAKAELDRMNSNRKPSPNSAKTTAE